MAISNAEKQAAYRERAKADGLVRLQMFIEADIDEAIGNLTRKFKVPRYTIIEHAVKELSKRYRLAESEQSRLSQGETYKTIT